MRNVRLLTFTIFAIVLNISLSAQVLVSKEPQSQPHGSAMLEVKSTSKGFLPPRMNKCERLAIANPSAGLMVFDTDKGCLFYFDGLVWQPLCGSVDLQKGLLSHYPFNGNVLDSTERQFHGIAFGSPVYTANNKGEAGKAILFDGINDYVLISDQGGLSTPAFTVSFLYKTSEIRDMSLISRVKYNDVSSYSWNSSVDVAGQGSQRQSFAVGSSSFACSFLGGSVEHGTDNIYSGNFPQLGVWKHAVLSFSKGVQKMYIDGVLIGMKTLNFQNAKTCTASQYVIGSWWANDKYLFKGAMDDLRIYDRELSEDEINALSGFSCVN